MLTLSQLCLLSISAKFRCSVGYDNELSVMMTQEKLWWYFGWCKVNINAEISGKDAMNQVEYWGRCGCWWRCTCRFYQGEVLNTSFQRKLKFQSCVSVVLYNCYLRSICNVILQISVKFVFSVIVVAPIWPCNFLSPERCIHLEAVLVYCDFPQRFIFIFP